MRVKTRSMEGIEILNSENEKTEINPFLFLAFFELKTGLMKVKQDWKRKDESEGKRKTERENTKLGESDFTTN